jgi:5-methylcytosine-specific restriction endonuclease McrA
MAARPLAMIRPLGRARVTARALKVKHVLQDPKCRLVHNNARVLRRRSCNRFGLHVHRAQRSRWRCDRGRRQRPPERGGEGSSKGHGCHAVFLVRSGHAGRQSTLELGLPADFYSTYLDINFSYKICLNYLTLSYNNVYVYFSPSPYHHQDGAPCFFRKGSLPRRGVPSAGNAPRS